MGTKEIEKLELNQREIEILRIGFNKGIECMEIHPEDDSYDGIRFNEALELTETLNKSNKSIKFVCRKIIKSNVYSYSEIGTLKIPTSNYRKEYPDSWCDNRICEGFWGSHEEAENITKILNKYYR